MDNRNVILQKAETDTTILFAELEQDIKDLLNWSFEQQTPVMIKTLAGKKLICAVERVKRNLDVEVKLHAILDDENFEVGNEIAREIINVRNIIAAARFSL